MTLDTLEALALLLVFAVPGAFFIYVYSLRYPPEERPHYLEQQFPIELVVVYVMASCAIHGLLVAASLSLLNLANWLWPDPDLLQKLTTTLRTIPSRDLDGLTAIAILTAFYSMASLGVAYGGAKCLRRWSGLPVPLWSSELLELAGTEREQPIQIKTRLCDGSRLQGTLKELRFVGGSRNRFEFTMRLNNGRIVWLHSDGLLQLDAHSSQGRIELRFPPSAALGLRQDEG